MLISGFMSTASCSSCKPLFYTPKTSSLSRAANNDGTQHQPHNTATKRPKLASFPLNKTYSRSLRLSDQNRRTINTKLPIDTNTTFQFKNISNVHGTSVIANASSSASSSGSSPVIREDPGIQWGADLKMLAVCLVIGVGLWFCPPPNGVTSQAWHLLAIFMATIVGIITTPLPLGAVALIALGIAMLTNVLSFSACFGAFSSEIPYILNLHFILNMKFT